jgi:histidinol-phosphate aminotransferase
LIKLDSNESPFGPSPKAVAAMQAAVEQGNRYPDNDASELRSRLAEIHSIQREQVLVTAGLTDFLGILCRALLKPGLNAVTSQRSFIVYPVATRQAGAHLVETPMLNDGFDLDAIASAVNDSTRIVFLANPNNPTGTLFDAPALDRLVERVPQHAVIVIDEAYYDYANHFAGLRGINYSRAVDYVRDKRNVLVLRTFSKVHGLAGVRVAYALGPAEMLKDLARLRSTFSVSAAAQAGALAALDDAPHITRALENNAAGAEWLARELAEFGYLMPQTWGNFVYCEVGQDAREFAKRMAAEGVLVRALTSWGAPTAIRVTVGKPEENKFFAGVFSKLVQQRANPKLPGTKQ